MVDFEYFNELQLCFLSNIIQNSSTLQRKTDAKNIG